MQCHPKHYSSEIRPAPVLNVYNLFFSLHRSKPLRAHQGLFASRHAQHLATRFINAEKLDGGNCFPQDYTTIQGHPLKLMGIRFRTNTRNIFATQLLYGTLPLIF